jgi:ribosome-associated protein
MTRTKSITSKRGGGNGKTAATGRARAAAAETPPRVEKTTEGLDGAMRALALALDKKALEPVLLDVRDLCSFCNYQLVISGRSDRQVDAIADGIASGLKAEGLRPLGSEGARTGQWALLDYGDFVVHVFLHTAREHYDLEGLWNDAPRVPIEVPDDARLAPAEPSYEDGAPQLGEAPR